jgi:hypothetical protein
MRAGRITAIAALAAALWGAAAFTRRAHEAPVPAPDDWCSLEGRTVSSTDGQPLKRVRLVLRREGSGRGQRLEATADSGGNFRFERLLPGNYRLSARRSGYLPEASDSGVQATLSFRLAPGERRRNLRVRLMPASQIRGRVVDAEQRPMPYARVVVTNLNLPSGAPGAAILERADSGGWFQAAMLRPGMYRLSALPQAGAAAPFRTWEREPGGTRQHFWRSRSWAAFMPAEDVVLDLEAGEDLSGVRVLLRNHSPAERALQWARWEP